jgi:hypothetical protein
MRRLTAFLILCTVKTLSHILFPGSFTWITDRPSNPYKTLRLMVFMNHTSLYEPIFMQALPYTYLWKLAKVMSVPGADVTLKRPIVGAFYKLMMPNIASVTRKQDSSWNNYLSTIGQDSVVVIAAEGRMKRPNGLDRYGKPMSIRGGVADIIMNCHQGGMVLCLSGGLHHIQSPGQMVPKFFKRIKMNFAYFDVKEYKAQFSELPPREQKMKIVQDLQQRLEQDCPKENT